MTEPLTSAVLVGGFGLLLTVAVTLSRASARLGVPLAVGFLVIGVLAGSEGIGRIPFENYALTYQIGTAALVLILFDGGLNTPVHALQSVFAPAAVLATVGVVLTALTTAVALHLFGYDWPFALLAGAIVSPTDAAAVFSALSSSGVQLKRRVAHLLEIESGLNDPMAVILTTALTTNLIRPGATSVWSIGIDMLLEMVIGGAAGVAVGYLARWRVRHLRLPAPGLYPAFTIGVACLAFGLASLAHGSGFLSVYVAGVVLGSGSLPYRNAVRRVHDALGWLAQIVMFLLLGLLVFPSRMAGVAGIGLGVALVLAFVSRPLVAALCLLPFRLPATEIAFVGWVGLRGAVPIVLATIPVMNGAPGSHALFNVVFVIIVVGSILPGATVGRVARWLKMQSARTAPPTTMVSLDAAEIGAELRLFFIEAELAVAGASVESLPFPSGAAMTMIERDGAPLAVTGATVLQPGDYAYILYPRECAADIELLFGPPLA
jgi:cell volume regulation protein A